MAGNSMLDEDDKALFVLDASLEETIFELHCLLRLSPISLIFLAICP